MKGKDDENNNKLHTRKQSANNTNFGLLIMDTPGLARKIGGELGKLLQSQLKALDLI